MPKSRRYHRAHDTELRQWAETGDLRAEFERLHREKIGHMVHDLTANPQISFGPPAYVVPLSEHLGLRVEKGATSVGLSLLLDEGTSKQAILDHWDEIVVWRDRLQKWHGPWSSETGHVAAVAGWHAVWRSGAKAEPSYATLAAWLNHAIASELAMFVASLQLEPPPGASPTLERLLDQPSWCVPSDHWASSLFNAVRIMEDLGMAPAAIRDYCLRAVAALTDAWTEVRQSGGHHTFDGWWTRLLQHVQTRAQRDHPIRRDQPLDRDHIISKLRQWRQQRPP